ncbi:MAG: WS/DGAT domain-containing protein, partial [Pseudomonadales bacterium]
RPWTGENEPNPLELMFRAQMNNITQPFRFAEVLARTVPALGRLGQGFAQRRFEQPRVQPPRTRFNKPVSGHCVVEGRRFDLQEVREIKGAVPNATINDAVLTIVGGALRIYLEEKLELPDESLIAMAPISVRSEDQKNAMGNQVAAMNVALGTDIGDPLERLRQVHDAAAASKAMTRAVGAKLMTDYSQFIPSTTAALAARLYTEYRLADRVNLPFNCVVTNVPGPQFPLYSAGARLVTQFGMGPIYDGMGLMFPVFSYCGYIMISLTACREMMPDPAFFGQCLDRSFAELKDATGARTERA